MTLSGVGIGLVCTHIKERGCDVSNHLYCNAVLLELIIHVIIDFSESLHTLALDLVLLQLVLECILEQSLVGYYDELV